MRQLELTSVFTRVARPAIAGAALLGALVAPVPELQDVEAAAIDRVRTTNTRIHQALRQGLARSPTFRAMVEALQQSDVILHIDPGECSCGNTRSCVTFVAAPGQVRYLRATVSLRQIDHELIAHVGHELFHATEIAAAPQVVSRHTLRDFYQQRGRRTCGLPCGYETEAAVRVHDRLRVELRVSRAAPPSR